MKKHTFQLLSLLLLFCMAGSFFACQKEEPSHRGGNLIEDGIKRSELRYVENPYFKDGKIYYTLVNNKNEKTTVSEAPPVPTSIPIVTDISPCICFTTSRSPFS